MTRRLGLLLLLCAAVSLAQAPGAFPEHLRAGEALFEKGEFDKAIREFKAAVKLRPNHSMAHVWLGRALGRKAEKSSPFRAMFIVGGVREAFERAVELDPANLDARADLLEFYLEAPAVFGGGMDKARAQAAALEKLDKGEGHAARALIAEKEKRYDVAEREYRAALAARPESKSYREDLERFRERRGRNGQNPASPKAAAR